MFDAKKEQLVLWLESKLKRCRSYKAIFTLNDKLLRESEIVLADLRKFCYFNTTTAQSNGNHLDPLQMARMEGRREVFMRILMQLNTDEAAIIKLKEND